jgi:nitrogen-specific signal transduction histidine kinase
LAEIKDQLERMSRILAEKEQEIANVVQSESDIIQKLRDKLEVAEEEKRIMKVKENKIIILVYKISFN